MPGLSGIRHPLRRYSGQGSEELIPHDDTLALPDIEPGLSGLPDIEPGLPGLRTSERPCFTVFTQGTLRRTTLETNPRRDNTTQCGGALCPRS